jgi:hypothetical protein
MQHTTNAIFNKGFKRFATVRHAGSFARRIQTQLRNPLRNMASTVVPNFITHILLGWFIPGPFKLKLRQFFESTVLRLETNMRLSNANSLLVLVFKGTFESKYRLGLGLVLVNALTHACSSARIAIVKNLFSTMYGIVANSFKSCFRKMFEL